MAPVPVLEVVMRDDSIPFPNALELAWAAGFFDGEGSTCITRHQPKNQHATATVILVSVKQTDREPLERFRAAVGGIGVINGPYERNGNKPYWTYKSSGYARVQAIVAALWRFLSTPKREQARCALTEMKANFKRPGAPTLEFCKRGHDLGAIGVVYRSGERRCVRCEQMRSLAGYYRRKGDYDEAARVMDGTHVSRKGWRSRAA